MSRLKQIWRRRSSFRITARQGPMPRGTVPRTAGLPLLPDNATIAVKARLTTLPLLINVTIAVTARLRVILRGFVVTTAETLLQGRVRLSQGVSINLQARRVVLRRSFPLVAYKRMPSPVPLFSVRDRI